MTNSSDDGHKHKIFGELDESTRKAALDVLGGLLIEARDTAIVQWDQILDGSRKYAPWERIRQRLPELEIRSRDAIREALPHIVDTFLYCLLSELDASRNVRVSILLNGATIEDAARKSWGLAAEPAGEHGWLTRFSKQRFEQPY